MDNKSNYTFSNKYNPSLDYNIFSEQNSRIINNNMNFNFKTQTNNYLGASYFNNTSNLNNSIISPNPSNQNSILNENYTKLINNNTKIVPKIEEENNKKINLNFMEEFDKIKSKFKIPRLFRYLWLSFYQFGNGIFVSAI